MVLKATVLNFSALFISLSLNAQNLPGIQKTSMKVPPSINVDGVPNEWGSFQAYNKNTEVFYSMANDDNKLYLCIKASSADVIKKIIGGGITLTINPLKKSKKNAITITYPIVENVIVQSIIDKQKQIQPNQTAKDSLANLTNKQIMQQAKTIKIMGIQQIPDSLIAIYNTDGIKVRALFDTSGNYIYEMAVDVKYISQPKAESFFYNIKLNGFRQNLSTVSASQITKIAIGSNNTMTITGKENFQAISSPTDFWGEYTLAKK